MYVYIYICIYRSLMFWSAASCFFSVIVLLLLSYMLLDACMYI